MKKNNILEVKRHHEKSLLTLEGVVGVGIGKTDYRGTQMPCISVYVEQNNEAVKRRVPKILDGYPVRTVEVGKAILH